MIFELLRISLNLKSKFNDEAKKYDLTFSQWQVLKLINQSNRGWMASELVEVLNSDKATISNIVKTLERKKMIIINVSQNDKRKKYIELSKSMQSKCRELKLFEETFEKTLREKLTEEEYRMLHVIIGKLGEDESKKSL